MPNKHPDMHQSLPIAASTALRASSRLSRFSHWQANVDCRTRIRHLICLITLSLFLSACDSTMFNKKEVAEPAPTPPPEPVIEQPSAEPIINVSKADIRFAQTVLNELGYKVGTVDGIWGPRSARAIRNFERINGLTSANGKLSELNLTMLERIGNSKRGDEFAPQKPSPSLSAKLDKTVPLEQGPQLVFTDKTYPLLAKPNPYSELLATLVAGTGIYVIRQQDGWFEVESEDEIRGFIQAN
ncbi:MAG: peptidoglycan-binding domain-containing protein [Pseudomonadota bacterium]